MPELQASWTPERTLFFWSSGAPLDQVVDDELPALATLDGKMRRRPLAIPSPEPKRVKTAGYEVDVAKTVAVLSSLPATADVSDSVRCWAYAAKFALELAAAQRVVPTVNGARAEWRALLTRDSDRARFQALTRALPPASRAVPTKERGHVRLYTPTKAARGFINTVVDGVYRNDTYPGSTRGWALEFAQALRSDDRSFHPRDARFQGVPEALSSWSGGEEGMGLRLGMELTLPESPEDPFGLQYYLKPTDGFDAQITLDDAWDAGDSYTLDERSYQHPAHAAMRGLARASRLFPPLASSLKGKRPTPLTWSANDAWEFLASGVDLLEAAGFEVDIPDEFAEAGRRRIRAQIRLDAEDNASGEVDLSNMLNFRWEVVLGDMVLDGDAFAELTASGNSIVRFRGEWVLLDPAELAKLPEGVSSHGEIAAGAALRAVLTGQLNGVQVVATDRLSAVIDALKNPPEVQQPEGLEGTLRPYQLSGYCWLQTLSQFGLGACLADDMGLGKTIQLIAHLVARRTMTSDRPSLVVCPTSVLGNWKREIARFAPHLKVLRYHGLSRDASELTNYDVVLTTYGLMVRDQEEIGSVPWDVVALDEAQSIKNPDSMRARSARLLHARHRVALSGTPVENRLDELWSLMHFLNPGLLGERGTFRRNVAIPVERYGDADTAHNLKLGISPFLLRRLKTDPTIITDLPEKLETKDYCPLTKEQAKLYREVVDAALNRIADTKDIERRGHVLAMLTALKQICNHPAHYLKDSDSDEDRSGKMLRCIEILDNILERGERALIFTQYREMGDLLQRTLLQVYGETVPFLHGGSTPEKRDEMVRAFQEDEDATPVLLVSLRAGGTGLNLTAATHVIHYDRWWNPAVEDQATDRAYRIGQQQNVHVHKMICQGSLEERIDIMLDEKRALAESVVGSGEGWVTELDDNALRALVALGEDAVLEDA